ncbi:MAG: hypothetical protein P8Z73_07680 [Desulfobacteraceae bacterium]
MDGGCIAIILDQAAGAVLRQRPGEKLSIGQPARGINDLSEWISKIHGIGRTRNEKTLCPQVGTQSPGNCLDTISIGHLNFQPAAEYVIQSGHIFAYQDLDPRILSVVVNQVA